ncbi:UNVERIFIED_CONTAM: hypothetical protein GTU68_045395 [Idotea baltica]|nr:hypothetical protein [Idotea baltica]
MKKILVLCTGNSCRSQMMHGYLQDMSGDNAKIYSAGVETHGVNPFAIGVMAEDKVFIHDHTSNHVDEYAEVQFDLVITVCDHAKEQCPIFPNAKEVRHHAFSDPSGGEGTAKELISAFRKTRGDIKEYASGVVKELF